MQPLPDRQLARLTKLLERVELECSLRHPDHAQGVISRARLVYKSVDLYWATHDEDDARALKQRFLQLAGILHALERRLGL